MNENIKIQEFRGKICSSLENYNDEITSLKVTFSTPFPRITPPRL